MHDGQGRDGDGSRKFEFVAGPVFATRSHPGAEPLGLEFVRELCQIALVPVIGIGGVTPQNAGDVLRAGASGVAVISAVLGAASPSLAARTLREALDVAYQKTNGAPVP